MNKDIFTPDSFIDRLLTEAPDSGYIESEIYFNSSESIDMRVFEGNISSYEASASSGLSFRGRIDEQMGYAYTETYDDEALNFLLSKAKENCAVIESDHPETLYPGDNVYAETTNFSQELDDKTFDFFAQTALSIEKSILKYDSRIVAVDYMIIIYSSDFELIRNTLGLDCRETSNHLYIFAESRCVSNGQTKTGYCEWAGRNADAFDINEFARKTAQACLDKLGAAPIPSGIYPVVFAPLAATQLLGAYSGVFSAESVQEGFSLLAGKKGMNVASDKVTLRDDAVTPKSIFAFSFDSEGVACKNKALIENGTLVSYLHNRKTAGIEGVSSSGNGFRAGYKGSINIVPMNFYLSPGPVSTEELFEKASNGLYITELIGLHAGVNEVSGDFSLSCEGFLITDGKKGRPVDQITVSGNYFRLLQSVVELSDDLIFDASSEHGQIGSPSILVEGLMVSGE